jgi:hypothetical protein
MGDHQVITFRFCQFTTQSGYLERIENTNAKLPMQSEPMKKARDIYLDSVSHATIER